MTASTSSDAQAHRAPGSAGAIVYLTQGARHSSYGQSFPSWVDGNLKGAMRQYRGHNTNPAAKAKGAASSPSARR